MVMAIRRHVCETRSSNYLLDDLKFMGCLNTEITYLGQVEEGQAGLVMRLYTK